MKILTRLKLRTKLALLLGLSIVAMVTIGAVGGMTLHKRMLDDRMDKFRAIVASAISIATGLEARVGAHEIPREEAIELFRRDIHAIRFDGGSGYLSVIDTGTGEVLIHGVNPKLEGKPSAIDTATKQPISRLVSEAVRTADEGSASYMFPRPGETEPLRKIVAVGKFSPWGMAIYGGAYIDDLETAFNASLLNMGAAGGATLVVTLVAAWLINRDITGSLGRLKGAMDRLVKGDLATAVPGTDRRDEVGGMAAAVVVFKDSMIETGRLRAEQEQAKRRADAERRALLGTLADDFESGVRGSLDALAAASTGMRAISQSMSATAKETSTQATTVAAAAEQASTNVQTVASTTEELSSSISEIGRQVNEATRIAGQAVDEADHTNTTVQGLSAAAHKIGDVVKLISDIASQTNLLALNATIEAARAGEAGRGFAVVASEVKSLANQTAVATEEIAAQVAAMQGATSEAVEAIKSIGGTIGAINTIATAIASAVEEQGAATQEIARNVQEAARGTQEVSSSVVGVNHAAAETGTAANQVLSSAEDLGRRAETLRADVGRFLANIRAVSDRGEREATEGVAKAGGSAAA
ncbi:methyl-accepting chemotaxis protein [Azospirillum sp. ST 5-10]|uniref:methyl-accepting chemotaxis protein n=1 Tax=unclassified Azospirillum TaxID=2630922 RepID=UPI003F4A4A51